MSTQDGLKPTWSPSEVVETLSACPVCSSCSTGILHSGLEDRLFGARGTWTLWWCHGCDVAFLNPRLTPGAIAEAYQRYYTHTAPRPTLRMRVREFITE